MGKGGRGMGMGKTDGVMANGELVKEEKVWEWGMEKGYGNGQKEKWRKRNGEWAKGKRRMGNEE